MHRMENVKNYWDMIRLFCYTSIHAVYFHDTCDWDHCNQFSYKFVSIRDLCIQIGVEPNLCICCTDSDFAEWKKNLQNTHRWF